MLPSGERKDGQILCSAGRSGPRGISAVERGDLGREVSRLQGDALGGSGDANGKCALFSGLKRGGIRFQREFEEHHTSPASVRFVARNAHFGGAGIETRWRQDRQRFRRRGKYERRVAVDLNSVLVGVTAEAMALQFKAIAQRGEVRCAINLRGTFVGGSGYNFGLHAAGSALNGGVENALRERRNKGGAASRVGGDLIAVGKRHGDIRGEPAAEVEYR